VVRPDARPVSGPDGSALSRKEPGTRLAYREQIERIRSVVGIAVPPGATVAVVSRGDRELLELNGRPSWHFPQTDDGTYAGHHPANSEDAIVRLERLRAKGAQYLLIPATAFWWLDHYAEFRQHLERWYRRVANEDDTCVIFSLGESPSEDERDIEVSASLRSRELVQQVRELVESTLPAGARILVLADVAGELPELDGREVWRFPRGSEGGEGADVASSDWIAELERLRAEGATFLLVPRPASWLLDDGIGFKRYIERRYPLVVRQEQVCLVYELSDTAVSPRSADRGRAFRRLLSSLPGRGLRR
jgi:hypothetical protein